MLGIITYTLIVISTALGVAALGLAAGFSPTLYLAQASSALSDKDNKKHLYTTSLIIGVILAITLLVILFQFFNLNTLLTFIDSIVKALLLSILFNILVGTSLVVGGLWYSNLNNAATRQKTDILTKGSSTTGAIIGIGFARTFMSISGVTATFAAGNLIADASDTILERLLFSAVFLIASVAPFLFILDAMRRNPRKLKQATNKIRHLLKKSNYHLVLGAIAIILGASIIIFNTMVALFY